MTTTVVEVVTAVAEDDERNEPGIFYRYLIWAMPFGGVPVPIETHSIST